MEHIAKKLLNNINNFFYILFKVTQLIEDKYCIFTLPFRNRLVVKSIACNNHNPFIRKRAFEELGVIVGEGTYFNPGIRIVNDYPEDKLLVLGKNVALAPGVILVCNSAPAPFSKLRENLYVKSKLICAKGIYIDDDSWIGAGAIILPGVRIGKGAIIGSGAIVTKDIPEYSIATGNPAKVNKFIQSPA
jgi:acetyltransferase-like isoleucine patch superfamily enzyme